MKVGIVGVGAVGAATAMALALRAHSGTDLGRPESRTRQGSISAPRPPTVAAPISAPPSVRMPVRSSSAWRPALQPARGALARALDALQALLAALADGDQLGLDLPAALDRQADRIRLRASGHGSVHAL